MFSLIVCFWLLLSLSSGPFVALAQSSEETSEATTFTTTPTTTTSTASDSESLSTTSTESSTVPEATSNLPDLDPYPPCVVQCLALSIAEANCTSLVDIDCFCPSDTFRVEYPNCIASMESCSGELDSAQNLVQQFCAQASQSTSVSFPSPTATPTSSESSSSSSMTSSESLTASSPPASATDPGNGATSILSQPLQGSSLLLLLLPGAVTFVCLTFETLLA